jgi:hypothetical protein
MGSSHTLDQLNSCFDDTHAVANAGLLLAATLAARLGIEQAADALIDLGERAGAYRPGRKLLTLVHAMLAGGDGIDDADLLRCGATSQVLGHRAMAPSTLGAFLRAFTVGHVRQTRPIRAAVATISEQAWVDIVYPEGGLAQVAETRYQGDRLIVRRARLVGAQAELFPTWRYHAFVTDRVGTAVWLDADHRRHAVVELCIRDLKSGVGLRHCPSGRFNANAAWLLIATLAHNLLRWIAAIGLGTRQELVVAKPLRRTLLALPGRITRSAGRLVLHLPAGWPWAAWFELAVARLRCVAYAT